MVIASDGSLKQQKLRQPHSKTRNNTGSFFERLKKVENIPTRCIQNHIDYFYIILFSRFEHFDENSSAKAVNRFRWKKLTRISKFKTIEYSMVRALKRNWMTWTNPQNLIPKCWKAAKALTGKHQSTTYYIKISQTGLGR